MDNYNYRPAGTRPNNGAGIRRLKRKNRVKSMWIMILLIVILILLVFIGINGYKQYKKTYKEPSYQYISMSEEASARAYVWLSKIKDTELSYDEVKQCMGEFNLEIVKTPTDVKGEYTYELADGAYEYCLNQAKVGLERAYKLAVIKRIKSTMYSDSVTDATVEELMMKTFGMSVSEYLEECDIDLLPEENEIELNKVEVHDESN